MWRRNRNRSNSRSGYAERKMELKAVQTLLNLPLHFDIQSILHQRPQHRFTLFLWVVIELGSNMFESSFPILLSIPWGSHRQKLLVALVCRSSLVWYRLEFGCKSGVSVWSQRQRQHYEFTRELMLGGHIHQQLSWWQSCFKKVDSVVPLTIMPGGQSLYFPHSQGQFDANTCTAELSTAQGIDGALGTVDHRCSSCQRNYLNSLSLRSRSHLYSSSGHLWIMHFQRS